MRGSPPVLVLMALMPASPLAGQLSHYWDTQFGNESVLLSGAVIGSVSDIAAVFYNPARILNRAEPGFVVSAKLYDWTTTRVEDGLGEGADVKDSSFGGAPGFLGGTFTLPFLKGHQFAYGFLTRHRDNVDYYLRTQRSGDLIEFLPGNDDAFVGVVGFDTEFKDDWIGASWAHPLTRAWSVGATAFYFDRRLERSLTLDLRAIGTDLDAASLQIERTYRLSDRGLLAKLGVAWQGESFSWGLTGTSPYWRIFGDGSLRYDNFRTGFLDDRENVLESSVQTGLALRWNTPWAVGTGLGWTRGSWQLHGAAEYFSGVSRHEVLRADPELGQSTDAPIDFTVTEERRSVLNGGIGARWRPSGDISAFASVATNFSSAPDSIVRLTRFEPQVSNNTLEMDFILFGGGISLRTRLASLTVGATWQGGSQHIRRVLNLPEEGAESQPDDGLARVVISQWRFVFGFSLPFRGGDRGDEGGS